MHAFQGRARDSWSISDNFLCTVHGPYVDIARVGTMPFDTSVKWRVCSPCLFRPDKRALVCNSPPLYAIPFSIQTKQGPKSTQSPPMCYTAPIPHHPQNRIKRCSEWILSLSGQHLVSELSHTGELSGLNTTSLFQKDRFFSKLRTTYFSKSTNFLN